MTVSTTPAGEAMREAVALITRAEVRDCIGPTIPLRRRWVDNLMSGPVARLHSEIARLTAERDEARNEHADYIIDLEFKIAAAEAALTTIRAQRDAARAEACPNKCRSIQEQEATHNRHVDRLHASSREVYARLAAADERIAGLRAALTEIRDFPETYDKDGQSWAVGYAFYAVQCRARAALANPEHNDA